MDQLLNQLTTASTQAGSVSHSPLSVLASLGVAVLLGSFLALAYNWTYTGKRDERQQITYTIILLTLGGALVWLLVADSLVRAFGIAGALSVIRYRTRVQDPKDTTLLFFGIIIGMACGLHAFSVATVGVLFIALVLAAIRIVNNLWGPEPSGKKAKVNGGDLGGDGAPTLLAGGSAPATLVNDDTP